MSQLTQQARTLIWKFWKRYLEDCDLQAAQELMDESCAWVSGGLQEPCDGLTEAHCLLDTITKKQSCLRLQEQQFLSAELSPESCTVDGTIFATDSGSGFPHGLTIRFSAVFCQDEVQIRLRHLYHFLTEHTSTPLSCSESTENHLLRLQLETKTKELEQLSRQDPLTGLSNRIYTENAIDRYLAREVRGTLFMIDIDNFKQVNDTFGHLFGDKVLIDIARKLRAAFRKQDIVGRIGGDEFVVFMRQTAQEDLVQRKAEEILQFFQRIYRGKDKECHLSGTIGIAVAPQDGCSFTQLMMRADCALYQVKRHGKNGYAFYAEGISM